MNTLHEDWIGFHSYLNLLCYFPPFLYFHSLMSVDIVVYLWLDWCLSYTYSFFSGYIYRLWANLPTKKLFYIINQFFIFLNHSFTLFFTFSFFSVRSKFKDSKHESGHQFAPTNIDIYDKICYCFSNIYFSLLNFHVYVYISILHRFCQKFMEWKLIKCIRWIRFIGI